MIEVNQQVNHFQHGTGTVIAVINEDTLRVQFETGEFRNLSPVNLTDINERPLIHDLDIEVQPKRSKRSAASEIRRAEKEAARAIRKESRIPSQLLAYVVENWTNVWAIVRISGESAFLANWLKVTGFICDQPYSLQPDSSRWGLGTRIEFPTPPSDLLLGSAHVVPNNNGLGSMICQNDFFWEFIAVVRRTGPKL